MGKGRGGGVSLQPRRDGLAVTPVGLEDVSASPDHHMALSPASEIRREGGETGGATEYSTAHRGKA